jgi:subtilase family serine protease
VASLGIDVPSHGTRLVIVPASTAPATYYLLACADDLARVTETDESNNCAVAAAQVTVGWPDLVVTELSDPPPSAARGSSFSVTETVANHGEVGSGSSTTRYYLGDRLLAGSRAVPALDASASFPATSGPVTVRIPTNLEAGTYVLMACADDRRQVLEGNETNNCRASITTVVVP